MFYELLAHKLTIATRFIWDDPDLDDAQKVERMKWANEIQHRVVSKISVERLQVHDWSESDFIGMVQRYVEQCPALGSDITWCINESYEAVLERTLNP